MAPHIHRCPYCAPNHFPDHAQPIREGHIGVRWDNGPVSPYMARVTVDGVLVRRCYEVLPGPDGYALSFGEVPHMCPCGHKGACREVLRGDVRWTAERYERIATDAGPLD